MSRLQGGSKGQLDSETLRRQTALILNSRLFRNAPKLQRLFRFLVNETLSGRVDKLTERVIAQRVFNRPAAFDSAQDAVVRVAAHRLRQALVVFYAQEEPSQDFCISIEAGSYRPNLIPNPMAVPTQRCNEALRLVGSYQTLLTVKSHTTALAAVKRALKDRPDDVDLLSAYADLNLDAHKYGFSAATAPLDAAYKAIDRASALQSDKPSVQFALGMFALAEGEMAGVAEAGRSILRSDPSDPAISMQGKWMLLLSVNPLDGPAALDACPPRDVDLPGWMNHPRFLMAYHCGKYEEALNAAIDFAMPHFFWGPLERAASLGQLGLRDAAKHELRRLIALNPNFTDDPRRHLRFHIGHQDCLEHVLEGLEKACLREFCQ